MSPARFPLVVAASLGAVVATTPAAAKRVEVFRTVPAGQPIEIRPDRSYVLFRTRRDAGESWAKLVLMRIQLREEQFVTPRTPNVQDISSKPTATGPDGDFYLIELPPGDYVVYGIAYAGYLTVCNCLGTVGFTASPGRVVDIGTYLADQTSSRSKVPELTAESDLGPSMYGSSVYMGATLVPAGPQSPALPGLDPSRVSPADFRVIGAFPNNSALYINRLAPIAGVLAYGPDGQVLDVKRNAEAPGLQ